ncbi:MAG: RloB family protein [Pontiella sp.]
MGKSIKLTDPGKAWAKTSPSTRKVDVRSERERLLIVCEGSKTEPNYFKSIQSTLPPQVVEICIQGEGANTQSLVDRAKQHRDSKKDTDYPYDEVWVVFDKDSFDAAMFDNAIHSAEAMRMKVAWSNQAFELWYILHFEARQTDMSRAKYKDCLTNHRGVPYLKNDLHMYSKLTKMGNESEAMRRAKQLQEAHVDIPDHAANPCTKVNELVEKLNTFMTR